MKLGKNHYLTGLIFFIALLLRLAYAVNSNDMPAGDAARYDALGLSLAQGKGYADLIGTPCSFYPPFYPFFLSIIYFLFGHSHLAVRIIQSVIGSFSCVLIWFIAKRLINNKAGLAAGIISAVYFPFIKSAGLLLTELPFTFLLLLITLFLIKFPEFSKAKNMAILGVLLGIAALTRTAALLYILFLMPVIKKRYIVVFIFFAALILPWTVRNFIVYHKIIPIATQGGITLYSSYCPPGGIFGKLAGDEDPVVAEANKISCPAGRSDFLAKQTVRFVRKNPGKILTLELKKILYFWAPFDWEIVGGRWFNIVYVLSAPFFIIGFYLAFKELSKFYPILLPVVYFQAVSLVFYGSPRFRLPVEPFLFILSTMAFFKFYGKLTSTK